MWHQDEFVEFNITRDYICIALFPIKLELVIFQSLTIMLTILNFQISFSIGFSKLILDDNE